MYSVLILYGEKMKSRIHVNQHNIRDNSKDNGNRPVFTVKNRKGNITANAVAINGPSVLIYRPTKPLSCGARAWIETDAEVVTS